MEGPPLGPGGEDINWPDQVAPRGRKASSTRKIKPQTSNLPDELVYCIAGLFPLDMLGDLFAFNHRLHRCCMECDGSTEQGGCHYWHCWCGSWAFHGRNRVVNNGRVSLLFHGCNRTKTVQRPTFKGNLCCVDGQMPKRAPYKCGCWCSRVCSKKKGATVTATVLHRTYRCRYRYRYRWTVVWC